MFCQKCGNEIKDGENFCGNCGEKITQNFEKKNKEKRSTKKIVLKMILVYSGILLAVLGICLLPLVGLINEVEVPQLLGLSIEEAKVKLSENKLFLEDESLYDNKYIIIEQYPRAGQLIEKKSKIKVTAMTKEDIKIMEEENVKTENAIKKWAELVRDENQGSVKYDKYEFYKNSNKGEKIYKIIYSTGADSYHYQEYYYQLVSLSEDLNSIKTSTKLYLFTFLSDNREGANQEEEMEWEAEQLWGI